MNIPEKDVYEILSRTNKPIIIYGMGNGADKIIHQLELRNIKISGIAASDDFVRGQKFHEFTVKTVSAHEKEFGDFIIIISFGTSLPDVMEHIFSLSLRHKVLAVDVPVYGENIWCMDFYNENRADIERAYNLFADDTSRRVYENVIAFKLTGELSYLRSVYSEKDEVFKSFLKLRNNENYLDLGAYRGDTIDELIHYAGGYSHITALEPDRKTFSKLKAHVKDMKNIRIYRMGIWSEDADITFSGGQGRGSAAGHGETVSVTKIDTLFSVRRVSYIKMDVEGCERLALTGGVKTIIRDKPKLNIAVYHRSEDIFSLPLQLSTIEPEYNIILRQHPYIPAWDLNMYAVCK